MDKPKTCYEHNKIFNERLRALAKRFGNQKISIEELENILFFVAAETATFAYQGSAALREYDDHEYWEYPETPVIYDKNKP